MIEDSFYKHKTIPPVPYPSQEESEPIPAKIGDYTIESLLAKGGMSTLFLGTHPENKDPIALKVLDKKLQTNPEIVQRFINEAEIIAMADHPNIVKMYGHGEWEGGLYIAMEFIQGVSLRQYLLQNPMSLKRALEIILEISYALCHLHTHGVIHRDLKPENILITEQGQVKVIDFGIAQLVQSDKSLDENQKKRLMGTPIYMSPEQRENADNVSYPSDIYSLGIIAYELILGKLSHGHIHLSLMPKGIQKILAKALQPSLEDRYQDIVDFITDLSAYLHSSNLLKDRKPTDNVSEIYEKLQQLQNTIFLPAAPEWPGIEINLAIHKSALICKNYHDFFTLPQNNYGIILAESSASSAEGLLYNSMLRSMTHVLMEGKITLEELSQTLNKLILKDAKEQTFTFAGLFLDPQYNKVHFLSCGYSDLYLIKEGTFEPTIIKSQNPALGMDLQTEFQSQTVDWHAGDTLLLTSLASKEDVITSEYFKNILTEALQQKGQKPADAILRRAKSMQLKFLETQPLSVLAISRTS